MKQPKAVLCIPGDWTDTRELLERIIRDSGGYLYAGRALMHIETKAMFGLEFELADPNVVTAFTHAGRHWSDTADMQRIAGHASVVYLIGESGSLAHANSLMLAADGLLKAGGLGVKVEGSGVAHGPAAWHGFAAEHYLFSAHAAFVLYLRGPDIYSCGMHHFGLPEAIVAQGDADDPVELLRIFTRYLLTEQPAIQENQTFSTEVGAPVFRIVKGDSVDYGTDSLFNNPYGMWRLETALAAGARAEPRRSKWWGKLLH